jgi:hypothetical protein
VDAAIVLGPAGSAAAGVVRQAAGLVATGAAWESISGLPSDTLLGVTNVPSSRTRE